MNDRVGADKSSVQFRGHSGQCGDHVAADGIKCVQLITRLIRACSTAALDSLATVGSELGSSGSWTRRRFCGGVVAPSCSLVLPVSGSCGLEDRGGERMVSLQVADVLASYPHRLLRDLCQFHPTQRHEPTPEHENCLHNPDETQVPN
jgi:hypothetical protein